MYLFQFMERKKGSISLFMAIIMLSMVIFQSVLVEGARRRSAETLLRGASDSAMMSVLAKYDIDLKDRYGLFALKEADAEKVQEDYTKFLLANLSAELPAGTSLDGVFDKLKEELQIKEEIGKPFDLYDFQKDSIAVNRVYSIIETEVLQKQIAEFTKYRGIIAQTALVDMIDEAKKTAKTNIEDVSNMESTIESRGLTEGAIGKVQALGEALTEKIYTPLSAEFDKIDDSRMYVMAGLRSQEEDMKKLEEYIEKLEKEMEKEEPDYTPILEDIRELYEKNIISPQNMQFTWTVMASTLYNHQEALQEYHTLAQEYVQETKTVIASVKEAKRETEQSKSAFQGGSEETTEGLLQDADKSIEELNKILDSNLETWASDIVKQIEESQKEVQELQDVVADIQLKSVVLLTESNLQTELKQVKEAVKHNRECIQDAYREYIQISRANTTLEKPFLYQTTVKYQDKEKANKVWDVYKENKDNQKTVSDETSASPNEIKDMSTLPSRVWKNYRTNDTYKAEDEAYIAEVKKGYTVASMPSGTTEGTASKEFDFPEEMKVPNNAEGLQNQMDLFQNFMKMLEDMANTATENIITDYYIASMFRNRITKSPEKWKEIYDGSQQSVKPKYDAERYGETDMNLMFEDKSNFSNAKGNCFFDGEIEYILEGNAKEKTNIDLVYAKIYGIRLVNNFIALYQNTEIRNLAMEASSIGGPFAPLVQLLIMVVLAMIETYIDMDFMIAKGLKVPLIKTKKNLNISLNNIDNLINHVNSGTTTGLATVPNTDGGGVWVKYEDYLYFFLLLVNREEKLLRTADLIQLNMQLQIKDDSYQLAEHYTHLRCDTSVTIKPMFLSYSFVPSDLKKEGRYTIRTVSYQGY